MVSVSVNAALTMPTPSTMASVVRNVRRGRLAIPLRATRVIAGSPAFMAARICSSVGSARSSTMRPSARNSTRSAVAAARGSWVTITVVWRSSSTASRSSASTSVPEVESRLPVGSSANRTVGCEASARAIATRCCWPPESCDGLWPRRSPRPTRAISESTAARSGLRPAIESGRRMFSSAVSIGSRLKDWNTKPMWRRRSLVSCLSPISVMSCAADLHAPVRRAVEPGEQVHERRLARARGAHDGGELADGDLERDAAQRVHGRLALAVVTGDPRGGDGVLDGRGERPWRCW